MEACFVLFVDFHAFVVGVFGELVSVDDDAVFLVLVLLAVEEHGHEVCDDSFCFDVCSRCFYVEGVVGEFADVFL